MHSDTIVELEFLEDQKVISHTHENPELLFGWKRITCKKQISRKL
jgi:hypothetical protein